MMKSLISLLNLTDGERVIIYNKHGERLDFIVGDFFRKTDLILNLEVEEWAYNKDDYLLIVITK